MRARQSDAWQHTAAQMALLANCNRDPKRRPRAYEPEDFMPTILRDGGPKRSRAIPGDITALKALLHQPTG